MPIKTDDGGEFFSPNNEPNARADLEEELPSVGVPLPFDARLVAMSMGLDGGSPCEDRRHRVLAAAVLMQMGLVERGL